MLVELALPASQITPALASIFQPVSLASSFGASVSVNDGVAEVWAEATPPSSSETTMQDAWTCKGSLPGFGALGCPPTQPVRPHFT